MRKNKRLVWSLNCYLGNKATPTPKFNPVGQVRSHFSASSRGEAGKQRKKKNRKQYVTFKPFWKPRIFLHFKENFVPRNGKAQSFQEKLTKRQF